MISDYASVPFCQLQHSDGFGLSNLANIKMTFYGYSSVDLYNFLFIAFVAGWKRSI